MKPGGRDMVAGRDHECVFESIKLSLDKAYTFRLTKYAPDIARTSSPAAAIKATTSRTVNSCRNPECHRAPDGSGFYCHPCEWRLWSQLQLETRKIHKAARRELVGFAGAVEKRHIIHLADYDLPFFTILHWARGRAEAEHFARRLVTVLRAPSRKLVGVEPEVPQPAEGNFYAVYLAWAPKRDANLSGFSFVEAGHDFVWPERFPKFSPLHLRSLLTQRQAKAQRPPSRAKVPPSD